MTKGESSSRQRVVESMQRPWGWGKVEHLMNRGKAMPRE